MQRRHFLGGAAAGLAAGIPDASAQSAVKAGDVPRRKFGKTGENLSVIGIAGGRFHLAGLDDAKKIVQRAYDLGLNYFDNARLYWGGRSEEVYGAVIPAFRKNIFVTTKSATYTKKGAEADLEASLKALKTDYVDLWQIHQVSEMKEVEQIFAPGGSIEAAVAAKKAGKCRFIGFTGHRDPDVHLAMLKNFADWDTILMPLHIADPSYLSFEKNVLPVAQQRGMGIQGMKSTANAKLLQQFSVKECISYTLSLPIHCLAVGCTTIGQLEDDVRIAQQFKPFSETQLTDLRQRGSKLKGPGLEDWKKNIETATLSTYRDGFIG